MSLDERPQATDDELGKAASGEVPPRVTATDAARALMADIRKEHPHILFHQSGGCCDGSSPMCYPSDDFRVGSHDVLLGEVEDAPVYIAWDQYEAWRHTQLILDVVPGRGGMFSLDNGREQRFHTRSRAFTEDELAALGIEGPVSPVSCAW